MGEDMNKSLSAKKLYSASRWLVFLVLLLDINSAALAVPAFSRQTGVDCSVCHVGSFGPQLTPYGMKFKMGGYLSSNGTSGHIPLSAMMVESFTRTKKKQFEDPAKHFDKNNNTSLQELSLFVAGRLTDHIGSFVQVTRSEPDRETALDNSDVRLAFPTQLFEKEALLGISLNNNPTLQDPFNSLPAWGFPYISSELAVESAASPLLFGGVEQQVVGSTAYGFYDDHWYASVGGYRAWSKNTLDDVFNITPEDKVRGFAPYWRLAYFTDMGIHAWHVGLFGMNGDVSPDWQSGPKDKYRDIGVDGSYEFLGTGKHVFSLNGAYVYERRNLDATYGAGDASDKNGSLKRFDLTGSYNYNKAWGVTLGLFDIHGSHDDVLYNTGDPDEGSIKGSPDTRGCILQADWTPWGRWDSWGAPWANVRLGLQYTVYTRFNGSSNNYDGFGHDASDNNTLFAFIWLTI